MTFCFNFSSVTGGGSYLVTSLVVVPALQKSLRPLLPAAAADMSYAFSCAAVSRLADLTHTLHAHHFWLADDRCAFTILYWIHFLGTMTLTDIARQQERTASRRPNPLKIPSIPGIARPKRTFSSVSGNGNSKIRQRLSRGVSNIRSLFKSRTADSDNYNNDYPPTQALLISQNGTQAGFGSAPSLTKNPLRLHLTGIDMSEQERQLLLNSGARSAEPGSNRQESPLSYNSAGPLHRRISQRFRDTFTYSNPTVIRKPELRSRPSVQTICNDRSSTASGSLSLQGSGSASTTQKHSSTPPTSDGMSSGSPGSVRRHEVDSAAASAQLLVLFDQNNVCPRKLSTIYEVDKQQMATIKTVEATAAAK